MVLKIQVRLVMVSIFNCLVSNARSYMETLMGGVKGSGTIKLQSKGEQLFYQRFLAAELKKKHPQVDIITKSQGQGAKFHGQGTTLIAKGKVIM